VGAGLEDMRPLASRCSLPFWSGGFRKGSMNLESERWKSRSESTAVSYNCGVSSLESM
jgi:hypothetical protein